MGAELVSVVPLADAPELLAPEAYSALWPWLGALLIGLAVGWCVGVILMTRSRPVQVPAMTHEASPSPSLARDQALAALDEVAEGVHSGRLTPRAAHHEVARVVRHFVAGASALDAHTMTASDLRRCGPVELAGLMERIALRQFGIAEATVGSVERTIGDAREVVGRWS